MCSLWLHPRSSSTPASAGLMESTTPPQSTEPRLPPAFSPCLRRTTYACPHRHGADACKWLCKRSTSIFGKILDFVQLNRDWNYLLVSKDFLLRSCLLKRDGSTGGLQAGRMKVMTRHPALSMLIEGLTILLKLHDPSIQWNAATVLSNLCCCHELCEWLMLRPPEEVRTLCVRWKSLINSRRVCRKRRDVFVASLSRAQVPEACGG